MTSGGRLSEPVMLTVNMTLRRSEDQNNGTKKTKVMRLLVMQSVGIRLDWEYMYTHPLMLKCISPIR